MEQRTMSIQAVFTPKLTHRYEQRPADEGNTARYLIT